MKPTSTRFGSHRARMLATALAACWLTPVSAQIPADENDGRWSQGSDPAVYSEYEEPAADVVLLTPEELDELVGPIALYPDDLLAIVLPASTYPVDVIAAARFLDKHEKNSSLQPDERWDDSVTALLNYPEVLQMMSEDVDWTWELGGAVLNQQPDVIEAVERFRDRAYVAGNLKSDEYQTVRHDGDAIEIVPATKEVIYVPYYEPRQVVIRHVETVYHYYPHPRPVYYYPYPAGHSFYRSSFWGVSTAFRIGWSGNHLSVWHYTFRGHPFYGHHYSAHYRRPSRDFYNRRYVRSSGRQLADRHRYGDRWHPHRTNRARLGDRPRRVIHRDRNRPDGEAHNPDVRGTHRADTRRVDTLRSARAREDFSTRGTMRERSTYQDDSARDRSRQRRSTTGEDDTPRGQPARSNPRERDTATAHVRRDATSGDSDTEDIRRSTRRDASSQSSRNTAARRTTQAVETNRTDRNRATDDRRASPETRTTRTYSDSRRSVSTERKPATRAKPSAEHSTRERGDRSDRKVKDKRKRRSGDDESERSRSRGENKSSRTARQNTRRH